MTTPEPELNVEAICPCGFGKLHSDGCVFQCDWTHKICLEKIAESVRDDVGIQALIQQVSDQRVKGFYEAIKDSPVYRHTDYSPLKARIDQTLKEHLNHD